MNSAARVAGTIAAVLTVSGLPACSSSDRGLPRLLSPPAGFQWLVCPKAGNVERETAQLGEGGGRALSVANQTLRVPPGTPPRTITIIVPPSQHLRTIVNSNGSIPNPGATLELGLQRCPGAIPSTGFLYAFRHAEGSAPHVLLDSVSAEQLRENPVVTLTGLRDFSGFLIATRQQTGPGLDGAALLPAGARLSGSAGARRR